MMKNFKANLPMLLVVGILGTSGVALTADNGVVAKQELTPGSYCHEKFPAIRPGTLDDGTAQLKSSTTGDIIDFYGSCDESPVGKDQVQSQKLEYEHQFDRD
jgi:hypothetical protein